MPPELCKLVDRLAGLVAGFVAANFAEVPCGSRACSVGRQVQAVGQTGCAELAPAARPFFATTAKGFSQVVSFVSVFHQYVLSAPSVTASQPRAKSLLAIVNGHQNSLDSQQRLQQWGTNHGAPSLSPHETSSCCLRRSQPTNKCGAGRARMDAELADLPRWQQAQQLGYNCCGINGCVLADRHQGACVFPEVSERRRRPTIDPKAAEKEASFAHSKPKKRAKTPPKTDASSVYASAASSSTSKSGGSKTPAPTPMPSAAAAVAAADGDEEAPAPDDVPCRKCGSRGGAKRMLLCDGEGGTCTAAYHTYCLTPPLLSAPKGDWFCPPCARWLTPHAHCRHQLCRRAASGRYPLCTVYIGRSARRACAAGRQQTYV